MNTYSSTVRTAPQRSHAALGLMAALSLLPMTSVMAGESERDQPAFDPGQQVECHWTSLPSATAEIRADRAEFCSPEAIHGRELSSKIGSLEFSRTSRLRLQLGGYDLVSRQFGGRSVPVEMPERLAGVNPPLRTWPMASVTWSF